MCVAVGTASLVVGLIGAGVQAVAGFQQARTQEKIAVRNAEIERARGRIEANNLQRRLRFVQGQAAADAAANGVGFDGSFLDIIGDNEIQGEVDIENAKRNAANRANIMEFEGKSAASRSRFGAIGALIGGGNQFLKNRAA